MMFRVNFDIFFLIFQFTDFAITGHYFFLANASAPPSPCRVDICYNNMLSTLLIYKYLHTCTIAQLITQPPKNTTAAQGTNATFSCRGNGDVFWEISGTQVPTEQLVQLFALEKVYVPLPTPSVSQLIMTATEMNNFTRTIQCLMGPGVGVGPLEESDPVHLLVYCEYLNCNIEMI